MALYSSTVVMKGFNSLHFSTTMQIKSKPKIAFWSIYITYYCKPSIVICIFA